MEGCIISCNSARLIVTATRPSSILTLFLSLLFYSSYSIATPACSFHLSHALS